MAADQINKQPLPEISGFSSLDPASTLCFIDTKTVGLLIAVDRIIEVGLICYDPAGGKLASWSALVNADVEVKNSNIHGITTEMIKTQGISLSVVLDVVDAVSRRVNHFIGHNYEEFDLKILLLEARRIGHLLASRLDSLPRVDTRTMSQAHGIRHTGLESCYRKIFGKGGFTTPHRALDDAQICAECYFWLRDHPDVIFREPMPEEARLHLGEYKGKTFAEIKAADPNYCAWVLSLDKIDSASLRSFQHWLKTQQ